MPKLTEAWVRSLPSLSEEAYHWDQEIRGFGLRCRRSGRRTWTVKYRTLRGIQRKATIGQWPIVDAAEARRRAKALLGAVADGKDPAGEKAAQRAKPTITDLVARYKAEHVLSKNKPSTAREFCRLLDKVILPAWGKSLVDEITSDDVAKLHHGMRAKPRTANHVVAVASKMFSLAERWKMRPQNSNPCRGLDRYAEVKRTRFPSEDELARLGCAVQVLTSSGAIYPQTGLAVRLLALTGLRLGELLALRWADVDVGGGALVIRDAKAGPRDHSVGATVLELLRTVTRSSDYVIAGSEPGEPLRAHILHRAWQKVRNEAKCPDLRLHDLRHGFGTYAAQTGANAFLIRDSLGHKTLAMTGRYVSRDANPLRDLTDQVAKRVGAALSRDDASAGEVDQLAFDFAA